MTVTAKDTVTMESAAVDAAVDRSAAAPAPEVAHAGGALAGPVPAAIRPAGLREVRCGGLPLLTGRFEDAADWIVAEAGASGPAPTIVTHINISNMYRLERRPALREWLARDGVMILDGIGLKVGGLVSGLGWLPDLNGTDLFPFVMERAASRGIGVFLLGGEPGVAERAAARMKERYDGIAIAGCLDGYFGRGEEAAIAARIRRSDARLLLVGRGFVRQEAFVLRQRDRLGVSLAWNVGGLFDFVSGAKPRAPLVLRRVRLEWLYRFLLEPRRMWRRNLVEAPAQLARILRRRPARVAERRGAARDE
ncbi:MAG: WecB/TagA/CpsF family glycosyltransferase [Candidatus Krumholzibacteriota bacterium]|nr:WecB/TagA/CpsF family glycosyltransferase [Candidatus Krumholzibacteriota bacterium]